MTYLSKLSESYLVAAVGAGGPEVLLGHGLAAGDAIEEGLGLVVAAASERRLHRPGNGGDTEGLQVQIPLLLSTDLRAADGASGGVGGHRVEKGPGTEHEQCYFIAWVVRDRQGHKE